MIRAAEALMMFSLFLVVFFAGVNYSDAVKSKASWLFEKEEVDVDMTTIKQPALEEVSVKDEEIEEDLTPPFYATQGSDFEPAIANKQQEEIPVISHQ